MPFTPSHPAAVIPFLRTPLVPAALVIGSMVPDLFYYVPLGVPRSLTHSPLGVVSVDLVSGVALFFVWQLLLRSPVLDLSPSWLRLRMDVAKWKPTGARKWLALGLLLVASTLIGEVTHVAWDSFTHAGPVVSALTALQHQIGPLPLYKWLQHASTVGGAAIIAIWVILWARRTPPKQKTPTRLIARWRLISWIATIAIGFGVAITIWLIGMTAGARPLDPSLVFRTITIGLASAGLVAMLLSVGWYFLPIRSEQTPGRMTS